MSKKFLIKGNSLNLTLKDKEELENFKEANKDKIITEITEVTEENKEEILERLIVNILWLKAEEEECALSCMSGLDSVIPRFHHRIEINLLKLGISIEDFETMVAEGKFNEEYLTEKYKDLYKYDINNEVYVTEFDIFTGLEFSLKSFVNDYLCGNINRVIICKDCGKISILDAGEVRWFLDKGLSIPKRCSDCRDKHKKS